MSEMTASLTHCARCKEVIARVAAVTYVDPVTGELTSSIVSDDAESAIEYHRTFCPGERETGHPFTAGATQATICVWILPDDPQDASITRYCGLPPSAHAMTPQQETDQ